MTAILKRELKSYFYSPLIYILMSIFFIISFVFFFTTNVFYGDAHLRYLAASVNSVFVFIVPMITMRLFSEEKTQRTDQLLFTSPNSITAIVLGKFLSALIIYILIMSVMIFYAFIISIYADFDLVGFIFLYIAEILIGAAFISVGLFVSSVSSSMMMSVLVSFGMLVLFYFSEIVPAIFGNPQWLVKFFSFFSLSYRFNGFAIGLLSLDAIVYYLSFASIFVFITIRMIDKKRWS
ncbi:MAG: ABC transporter permease subunit [Clostridia bacterium]|nr:ABC transporter permease [Oscillospiraceae bacterium]MBR4892624.1 ABC transporter permease subunit [Clostridia bacterium]